MIQIKKTKGVEIEGDWYKVVIRIFSKVPYILPEQDEKLAGVVEEIWIPMKSVFQVKRGLESYIQRFYRKHEKVSK